MAKKRFSTRAVNNAATVATALTTLKALWDNNPEIRETVENAARNVADSAKKRMQNRQTASAGSDGETSRKSLAISQQARLEQRAAGIERGLNILRSIEAPEAADALAILDQRLNEVKVSLSVAKTVPRQRRKENHREAAEALLEMEQALMRFTSVGRTTLN